MKRQLSLPPPSAWLTFLLTTLKAEDRWSREWMIKQGRGHLGQHRLESLAQKWLAIVSDTKMNRWGSDSALRALWYSQSTNMLHCQEAPAKSSERWITKPEPGFQTIIHLSFFSSFQRNFSLKATEQTQGWWKCHKNSHKWSQYVLFDVWSKRIRQDQCKLLTPDKWNKMFLTYSFWLKTLPTVCRIQNK